MPLINRSLTTNVVQVSDVNNFARQDSVSLANVAQGSDFDLFRFELKGSSSLNVVVNGLSQDVNLVLIRGDGEILQESNNPGSMTELINRSKLAAGTYFLGISLGGGKFVAC